MIILSDLDGTLADIRHRFGLLRQSVIDWDAVAREIAYDKPRVATIYLLQTLVARGHLVHILTGRGEQTRVATETWLETYHVPYHALVMRPAGDVTPNHMLKRDWVTKRYPRNNILFAFEDSDRVTRMLRVLGILTFQVDPMIPSLFSHG